MNKREREILCVVQEVTRSTNNRILKSRLCTHSTIKYCAIEWKGNTVVQTFFIKIRFRFALYNSNSTKKERKTAEIKYTDDGHDDEQTEKQHIKYFRLLYFIFPHHSQLNSIHQFKGHNRTETRVATHLFYAHTHTHACKQTNKIRQNVKNKIVLH